MVIRNDVFGSTDAVDSKRIPLVLMLIVRPSPPPQRTGAINAYRGAPRRSKLRRTLPESLIGFNCGNGSSGDIVSRTMSDSLPTANEAGADSEIEVLEARRHVRRRTAIW